MHLYMCMLKIIFSRIMKDYDTLSRSFNNPNRERNNAHDV